MSPDEGIKKDSESVLNFKKVEFAAFSASAGWGTRSDLISTAASAESFEELDHRAEATVLMTSLRVPPARSFNKKSI